MTRQELLTAVVWKSENTRALVYVGQISSDDDEYLKDVGKPKL